MKFFAKVFSEDNGNPSYIRIQSFVVLILFVWLAARQEINQTIDIETWVILLLFVFAPKVAQKFAEQNKYRNGLLRKKDEDAS